MKAGRTRRFQAFFAFGIDFPGGIGYNNTRRDILRWRQAQVISDQARRFRGIYIVKNPDRYCLTGIIPY